MDAEAAIDRLTDRIGASRSEVVGLVLLLGAAAVLLLVLWWWQRPAEPTMTTDGNGAVGLATAQVVVHVTGEVRLPGVVTIEDGARVIDVIEAAGGAGSLADLAGLNLARLVVDGEQIVVPMRRSGDRAAESPVAGGSARDAQGRLNINLASADELQELPGVGPVLAQRIVDHREANGPFLSPGDLRAVAGIGEKTFQSIAPLVTV